MIFKNKHSEKAFFTVEGNTRNCIKGLYETEDKSEIEFLKSNSNFIIVEKEVIVEEEIEVSEEVEEEIEVVEIC